MNKILFDIFTGPDGKSFEISHFLWALAVVVFLGIVVYVVIHSGNYPSSFGADFLALNAGGAGGSFARAKSDQTLKVENGNKN